MYFVSIHILKTKKKELVWLYGVAVEAEQAKGSGFTQSEVREGGFGELWRMNAVLTQAEFEKWFSSKEAGSLQFALGKDCFAVNVPAWAVRRRIYAVGNEEHVEAVKSVFNNTSVSTVYFALNKEELLKTAFPLSDYDSPQVLKAMGEVESAMVHEGGLKLFSAHSDRLGNLEIYRSPQGKSLRLPVGIHTNIVRKREAVPGKSGKVAHVSRDVEVWLDSSMKETVPVTVNVVLRGGRNKTAAIVADVLFSVPSVGHKHLVTALEPISSVEIKAWNQEGGLIHYSHKHLIRSIHISMDVVGQRRRVVDPWSAKLPAQLREGVERVEPTTRQTTGVGGYEFDPWVLAADRFEEMLSSMRESKNVEWGAFYEPTQQSEVAFHKRIQELISQEGVSEAWLVDPYFSKRSAERFLTRETCRGKVVVITSLHSSGENPETAVLVDFLRQNQSCIGSDLKIYNIASKSGSGQQFHDRFLVLKKDEPEVWVLTNSFHSLSNSYPSLLVRVPSSVCRQVWSYLSTLRDGHVTGRPEAESTPIWPLHKGSTVELLRDEDELVEALTQFDSIRPHLDWATGITPTIKEGGREGLLQSIQEELSVLLTTNQPQAMVLLKALSKWHYHGSEIAAKDIAGIQGISASLREHVNVMQHTLEEHMNKRELEWHVLRGLAGSALQPVDDYECFYQVLARSYEYDGLLRDEYFLIDLLYESDKATYFELLDSTWVMLPHWLEVIHHKDAAKSRFEDSRVATITMTLLTLSAWAECVSKQETDSVLDSVPPEVLVQALLTTMNQCRPDGQWKQLWEVCINRIRSVKLIDFVDSIKRMPLEMAIAILDDFDEDNREGCRRAILDRWIEQAKSKEYFAPSSDIPDYERAARLVVAVHGNNWGAWFDELLNSLLDRSVKNPMYLSQHYMKWARNTGIVLNTHLLGATCLLEDGNLTNTSQVAFAGIIGQLRSLSPDIWMAKIHEEVLLEILIRLAHYACLPGAQQLQDDLVSLVNDSGPNPIFGLVVYFSHQELFLRSAEKALELLNSPDLLFWLGQESLGRLTWLSQMLGAHVSNFQGDEKERMISFGRTIDPLVREAATDLTWVAYKYGLEDPGQNQALLWNWGPVLGVSADQLKRAWVGDQDFNFFSRLLGLGLYLFGGLDEFRKWLSEAPQGESRWQLIVNGKGSSVLEELFRIITGIPSA